MNRRLGPVLVVASLLASTETAGQPLLPWQARDIALMAAQDHAWWEFPVRVVFQREGGTESLAIEAFWDGGRHWTARVALPRPGVWNWHTESRDSGLADQSGRIEVAAPSSESLTINPNLRGQIRIAAGGRYFEYADGKPFFLLADTLWAGNTARCGLGANEAGPFFQHLADRRAKGFTAVLMQYFHGYGDYPDSPGHRNEGGKPYRDIQTKELNAAHFQALDERMRALWERGFVVAIPTTWWGKTNRCVFTPEDARRMSAYCAVRYGAFNAIWCLSGEYQYAFKDCGWTPADFTTLGNEVQRHNPYRHPLSIHPSGQITWQPPHHVQSSLPFHGESWLDHHWLQTGQSVDRMFNIVTRLEKNRSLQPTVPVFCSESYYERVGDPDTAYHTRWQLWTALLNGAAGYGYGAQGVWQFLDPGDPAGETGKVTRESAPWREAVRLPGSEQVRHAPALLGSFEWWKLQPRHDKVLVNGKLNVLPTPTDLTPPQAASIADNVWLVYVPRGNSGRRLALEDMGDRSRPARWYSPRTGEFVSGTGEVVNGTLPPRPSPADEDWVLLIE